MRWDEGFPSSGLSHNVVLALWIRPGRAPWRNMTFKLKNCASEDGVRAETSLRLNQLVPSHQMPIVQPPIPKAQTFSIATPESITCIVPLPVSEEQLPTARLDTLRA